MLSEDVPQAPAPMPLLHSEDIPHGSPQLGTARYRRVKAQHMSPQRIPSSYYFHSRVSLVKE